MKLTGKQIALIAVAGLAGIFLAVWAFRTRYGRQLLAPVVKLESAIAGNATPPMAQPRYLGFGGGEYYDPFGNWPYGGGSNYQLFLNTNSGVPTTQLPNSASSVPSANTAATALSSIRQVANGFGGGGGMGNANGAGMPGSMNGGR